MQLDMACMCNTKHMTACMHLWCDARWQPRMLKTRAISHLQLMAPPEASMQHDGAYGPGQFERLHCLSTRQYTGG